MQGRADSSTPWAPPHDPPHARLNITTYVDGQVQLSYDNRGLGRDDWPYDDPFYVIFNLAWGGSWGGAQGVDESALPCTMEVDYVRVFQKK